MTDIPILDNAYMERRAAERRMKAMFRSLSDRSAAMDRAMRAPDTEASLTKLYLAGELTTEQFENRLDKLFNLR